MKTIGCVVTMTRGGACNVAVIIPDHTWKVEEDNIAVASDDPLFGVRGLGTVVVVISNDVGNHSWRRRRRNGKWKEEEMDEEEKRRHKE